MADRAYDTDTVREQIQARGSVPNIPSTRNRRWKHCFNPVLYRGRNAVERMFGRLKDFRRIATRHDKLAANFPAAVHLAAAVSYWSCVRTLGSGPADPQSTARRDAVALLHPSVHHVSIVRRQLATPMHAMVRAYCRTDLLGS